MTEYKKQGFIHIYYGNGRGKTSILNGTCIRALGANLKVIYLRFFKNRPSAELDFFKNYKIKLEIISFYKSSTKFIWNMNEQERKIFYEEHLQGLNYFAKIIKEGKYDVVIADEIIDVVTNKIVSDLQLANILKQKANHVEVLLSGHMLPLECSKIANLISEIKLVKHYYNQGVKARQGIEF